MALKKKKKIIHTCTRWHNELNPHTDNNKKLHSVMIAI